MASFTTKKTVKPVTNKTQVTQPAVQTTPKQSAINNQVNSWRPKTTTPSFTSQKTVGGVGKTNAPAPVYSDDDYRTPVTGVYVPGLAPTNNAYKANEALKGTNMDFTKTGTGNTGSSTAQPTTPNTGFDMDAFTGMFEQYNTANTERFSALEKMIADLVAGNKYTASQQNAGNMGNTSQGVYDGSHIYTAPNQGNAVGSTQGNNAVNDTLHKYLQNIWNGGF